MEKLKKIIKKEKKQLLTCLLFTFIIGLIAHSYMYFNNAFSHDSLSELVNNSGWKLALGRVLIPIYLQLVRGVVTLPWLIGIISIFFVGLSVYLISKIFDIKDKIKLFLISGIMVCNQTVIICTSTYIHDLDCDMLALLLSVTSVFIFNKYKKGYLFGMIPLALCLGLYQSYISVAICLIMIKCIIDLINDKEAKSVVKYGLKGILMIIGAGGLYFLMLKILLGIYSVSIYSGGYNSIDNFMHLSISDIIRSIISTYAVVIKNMFMPLTIISKKAMIIINCLIYLYPLIGGITYLFNKNKKTINKIIMIILVLLLPIGMNVSRILAGNMSYILMHYAVNLGYILALLLVAWNNKNLQFKQIKKTVFTCITCVSLALLIFVNVKTANAAYFIKKLSYDANLVFYTKVTNRIEELTKYKPGEIKVAFIGNPTGISLIGNGLYTNAGIDSVHVMSGGEPWYYGSYFTFILNEPFKIVSTGQINDLSEVKNMAVYPNNGSVKMIDDVVVVKFSEIEVSEENEKD